MKTSYGLEFDTVTEINPEWSDYDKTIARVQAILLPQPPE